MITNIRTLLFGKSTPWDAGHATVERRDELERMRVAIVALCELLVMRTGITPDEISKTLHQADLLSRMPPVRCSICKQPADYRQETCAFCNARIALPSDASELAPPTLSGRMVVVGDAGGTPFLDGESVDAALVEWENIKASIHGKNVAKIERTPR